MAFFIGTVAFCFLAWLFFKITWKPFLILVVLTFVSMNLDTCYHKMTGTHFECWRDYYAKKEQEKKEIEEFWSDKDIWASDLPPKEAYRRKIAKKLEHKYPKVTRKKRPKITEKQNPVSEPHMYCREEQIAVIDDSRFITSSDILVEIGKLRVLSIEMIKDKKINAQTPLGDTLLHGAASVDSTATVLFLLHNGADPNIRNKEGKTPYDIAVHYNATRVAKILRPLTHQRARHSRNQSRT